MTVVDWLLDSDPSVRWQVMRDLTGAPSEEVAAERVRVATEGAGARLLALQGADGRWGGAAWNRGWNSTMHVLMLLRDMGLDPASDQARRAVGLVRDRVAEAIEVVVSKRDGDGRWPLEVRYPGESPVETDEGEGRPSRWNTLRALRVLRWYQQTGS